uniref:Uncharacterized protein n=1 Tax=viral metagenome TaxID=1070528 RepID=A0A6C0BM36_9ZZZZ
MIYCCSASSHIMSYPGDDGVIDSEVYVLLSSRDVHVNVL